MKKFVAALKQQGVTRSETTFYNIEAGRTQPSDELLNAMTRVFDCPRSDLLLRPTSAQNTAKKDERPAALTGGGPSS